MTYGLISFSKKYELNLNKKIVCIYSYFHSQGAFKMKI